MRFVAAVGEAGDTLGHHPSVAMGKGYVDLELVTEDAIYRMTRTPNTSSNG